MEDVQPTSATFPSSSAGRVSGHGGISGSYTVGVVKPSSKKFKNRHVTGSLNRLQQQTNGLRIDEGFFQRLTPKPFIVGKRFGTAIFILLPPRTYYHLCQIIFWQTHPVAQIFWEISPMNLLPWFVLMWILSHYSEWTWSTKHGWQLPAIMNSGSVNSRQTRHGKSTYLISTSMKWTGDIYTISDTSWNNVGIQEKSQPIISQDIPTAYTAYNLMTKRLLLAVATEPLNFGIWKLENVCIHLQGTSKVCFAYDMTTKSWFLDPQINL